MDRKTLKSLGFEVRTNESEIYLTRRCVVCGAKLPEGYFSLICGQCERDMHKISDED